MVIRGLFNVSNTARIDASASAASSSVSDELWSRFSWVSSLGTAIWRLPKLTCVRGLPAADGWSSEMVDSFIVGPKAGLRIE